jgi:hypothetical protein
MLLAWESDAGRPGPELETGESCPWCPPGPLPNYGTAQIYNQVAYNSKDPANTTIDQFGDHANDAVVTVTCVNNVTLANPNVLSTVNWGYQFTWNDLG